MYCHKFVFLYSSKHSEFFSEIPHGHMDHAYVYLEILVVIFIKLTGTIFFKETPCVCVCVMH
jgi:hypothetical protein